MALAQEFPPIEDSRAEPLDLWPCVLARHEYDRRASASPAQSVCRSDCSDGEQHVCASIIVAAELRYGVVRKASVRLAAQLETVLAPSMYSRSKHPWTAASMVNVDSVYGELRARLERAGQSICATICSLPLTP